MANKLKPRNRANLILKISLAKRSASTALEIRRIFFPLPASSQFQGLITCTFLKSVRPAAYVSLPKHSGIFGQPLFNLWHFRCFYPDNKIRLQT